MFDVIMGISIYGGMGGMLYSVYFATISLTE